MPNLYTCISVSLKIFSCRVLPAVFIFLGVFNRLEITRITLVRNKRVDIFLLQYFIEPATGQKFRSVPEVQRYLASQKYSSKCRALTLRNHSTVSNPIKWFLNSFCLVHQRFQHWYFLYRLHEVRFHGRRTPHSRCSEPQLLILKILQKG